MKFFLTQILPQYQEFLFSLRKNISLVSQDTTLFDDTIRNNIAYPKLDASQEEIEEAAKYSYASEFIENLPQKYETKIGENGIYLAINQTTIIEEDIYVATNQGLYYSKTN